MKCIFEAVARHLGRRDGSGCNEAIFRFHLLPIFRDFGKSGASRGSGRGIFYAGESSRRGKKKKKKEKG